MKFVENGSSPSNWYTCHYTGNHSPNGIVISAGFFDPVNHAHGSFRIMMPSSFLTKK